MKKEKELKQRVLAYVQEADEELLHLIAEVAETYKKQKKVICGISLARLRKLLSKKA